MERWVQHHQSGTSNWIKVLFLLVILGLGLLLLWRLRLPHSKATVLLQQPPISSPSILISSGTIGEGGSLSHSMSLSGINALQTSQVEHALKPIFNPRNSKAQDYFQIQRSTSGQFIELQYWPTPFESFIVERIPTGDFVATAQKVPLQESLAGVSGQIQTTLWDAMKAQNVPPEMIYRFEELFGWRIDFFTEPRRGDVYKMVWKRGAGNGAVREGDIVCAYYNSEERGEVYAYALAGDYYDADGDSLRGEFLRAPFNYRGFRISSRFTEHRFHPILRIFRPHHGIDYAAPRGTPAITIGEGVVIAKDYNGGLGNEIRVRHAGGYVSIYGHLMGYPRGIHIGSQVKQGQVVGFVGSTGLSTGPHLHFGLEHDGKLMDFLKLKTKYYRKSVPPGEQKQFSDIKVMAGNYFEQLSKPAASGSIQPVLLSH